MTKFWIFLIAFALALLAKGDTLTSVHGKGHHDISPVSPPESEVIMGDFSGHGPVTGGRQTPKTQEWDAEKFLPKHGIISGDTLTSVHLKGRHDISPVSPPESEVIIGDFSGHGPVTSGRQTPKTQEWDAEKIMPRHGPISGDDEDADVETEDIPSGRKRTTRDDGSGFHERYNLHTKYSAFTSSSGPADDEDADGETEDEASWQKRAAADEGSGFDESSMRGSTMGNNRPFTMPASEVRWRGFSLAHAKSRDGAVDYKVKRKKKGGGLDDAVGSLSTVFILGGTMLVLLFGVIFLLAIWPVRKYFQYLLNRTAVDDVESGLNSGELTSIRVDRSYPSERPSGSSFDNNSQFTAQEQTTEPSYLRQVGNDCVDYEQPHSSGVAQSSKTTPDQSSRRPPDKIIAEDRKRDFRNAERRKVIKRKTSEKRGSLVDSLLTAKEVIDGDTKDREFEEKASERRRKIQQRSSYPGAPGDDNKRRKSFADQVQSACSVIKPNWDDDEKLEQSKETCRKIKNQIASKRRPSLLDQIQVAKEVIEDREKKYSYALATNAIKEAMNGMPLADIQPNAGDVPNVKDGQTPNVDELTRLWGWTAKTATDEQKEWMSRSGWTN